MTGRKRLPVWVWVVLGLDVLVVLGFFAIPDDMMARVHCPDGRLEVHTRDYSYKPGQRGTEYITICVEDGERREVGGRIFGSAAVMLTGVIAVPVIAVLIATRRRTPKIQPRRPLPPR